MSDRQLEDQDTTTCTICGNALTHVPLLGQWIAHPMCIEAVTVRVNEAFERGHRMGQAANEAGIVNDLKRMLGVCEYAEVRAFIPLLIDRIKSGEMR